MRNLKLGGGSDQGFEFSELREGQQVTSYEMCLVGTFVTSKTLNFTVMKHRMTCLWQPGRGISITDLGGSLILFRFFHSIDL